MRVARPLLRAVLTTLLCACASAPRGPEAELTLLNTDADVWSWRAKVQARIHGAMAARCTVVRNEQEQAAQIAGAEVSAEVRLAPGDNVVFVRCSDQQGRNLRSASARLIGKLHDRPNPRAKAEVRAGTLVLDASESSPCECSGAPLREFSWTRVDRSLTALREQPLGSGARIEVAAPTAIGVHEYAVRVRDERGREDVARVSLRSTTSGQLEPLERAGPAWLEGAVVYGVVPPLFGQPPLASVTRALDDLRELGVRALWLSPVFASPPGDFGYAVSDYFSVRSEFGGTEALRTLVHEAHARGLRVLLDMVINHSSDQHPYFVHSRALGVRSHYFDFYQRDARGAAAYYFDWKNLPNLEYENGEVQSWALAFSRHWVEQLDVDGYRVDAAWGVRQRKPSFFPEWSSELRRIKPDVFLLAEASARDPYYLQHGFDAAYDWTDELGHHAWEHLFDEPTGIARRLAQALERTAASSPAAAARAFRFLNNNDTGKRFITRFGEPLTRVATAALLTLPGIPCLYALDEVGGEYEPYEESEPVRSERQGLRAFHRTLIALRANTPALARGDYRLIAGGERDELLAFTRKAAGGELALIALNFGATPLEVELEVPPELMAAEAASTSDAGVDSDSKVTSRKRRTPHETQLRDALMGTKRTMREGRLGLRLAPWEIHILVAGAEPPLAPL